MAFKESFLQRHLGKIGIVSATFASICLFVTPAIAPIASELGLGFLRHNVIVAPLVYVFLAISLWSLYSGARHHRSWTAYALGLAGAILIVTGSITNSAILKAIGIIVLLIGCIVNLICRRKHISSNAASGKSRTML
jgi:hypothetical protein